MATWTDSTLSNKIKIKAVHVNEVKNAIQSLIDKAKLSSTVSIGTINTSKKVLESNISKLQKSINALETNFSGNCAKTQCTSKCESCQDSCTQCKCQSDKECKCQSCQDTCKQCICQTDKCQKCQSQCQCYDGCYDGCSGGDDYGSE